MYADYLKFLNQRDEVQWEILWRKGHLIKEVRSLKDAYSLYGIDDYFFKVIRCPKTNKITGEKVTYYSADINNYV